tara:strand:+ start:39430 stop:39891 length:462 start_codon:yes stop_codon:yes gene_type:complete
MKQESNKSKGIEKAERLVKTAVLLLSFATLILLILIVDPQLTFFDSKTVAITKIDEDKIENGIHVRTGFKDAEGLMTVVNNCTNCHSAKLVIQNRMNKERWDATIKWMQETQNLWDLGDNQEIIVNYLVANYPATEKGRRATLTNIEWYELKD